MRVNARMLIGHYFTVLFNGEPQEFVVECDTDEGWILRVPQDETRKWVTVPPNYLPGPGQERYDDIIVDRLVGTVEVQIHFKDEAGNQAVMVERR